MKIAIDATILRNENTGTGFYIINLLNGLIKIDSKNEFIIFGDEEVLKNFINFDNKNFKIANKKFKNKLTRVTWDLFIQSFILKKLGIDILHSPNYITPLIKRGFKVVVTIHDITFFLMSEKYTITKRIFYKHMVPFFIRVADKIISVSQNTKKDIIEHFKIPEDKVDVTFESYPEYYNDFKDKDMIKKTLKKYSIDKEFALFVGMIEPRKNILSILKAFVELDKELNIDLVIVGKKGWYFEEIDNFINSLKNKDLKNKIIFTGFINEDELICFYQEAMFFIFPSFYEGFGLPPLQAMACGTPVITSNISSLPEVVEDAAIKINPNSLEELKASILLLHNSKSLRDDLSSKGEEQCKKFSLERFAKNTIEVYKSLLK